MEDINKMIISQIREMKDDLKEDIRNFVKQNSEQHNGIITRQDYTNGCIAEAKRDIAKMKTSQITLRAVLIGIAVTLFALGFMPERMWEILKMAF